VPAAARRPAARPPRHTAAVGAHRQALCGTGRGLAGRAPAGLDVPEPHRLVLGGRERPAAVGQERHAPHHPVVPLEHPGARARGEVPQSDVAALRAGEGEPAVRAHGHRVNPVAVAAQGPQQCPPRRIPNAQRAVHAAGHGPGAIRGEDDRADPPLVSLQDLQAAPRGQLPHAHRPVRSARRHPPAGGVQGDRAHLALVAGELTEGPAGGHVPHARDPRGERHLAGARHGELAVRAEGQGIDVARLAEERLRARPLAHAPEAQGAVEAPREQLAARGGERDAAHAARVAD
jgi:hypothetical protein